MEWLQMCIDNDFYNVVVSLKASNTIVMVEAYRLLAKQMEETGVVFPLHLGVTEAGNGDGGRIKSAVGISALQDVVTKGFTSNVYPCISIPAAPASTARRKSSARSSSEYPAFFPS